MIFINPGRPICIQRLLCRTGLELHSTGPLTLFEFYTKIKCSFQILMKIGFFWAVSAKRSSHRDASHRSLGTFHKSTIKVYPALIMLKHVTS